MGKVLLSLIPTLSLSDDDVGERLKGLLPGAWNDSGRSVFLQALDKAVKECREYRNRGGQLVVYGDDGKGKVAFDASKVPDPELRWTFGVTSATDQLESVGKTFLRCSLNGEVVELDIKGVYRLIAELERAKNTIELLEGDD